MKDNFLKMNKPLEKIIYNYKLQYLFIFILSLIIPTLYILYLGEGIEINKLVLLFTEIFLILLNLDIIIFNLIKKEYKIQDIFLSLMIPIGCTFLIILLPNYVPDEAAHSYRAYVISEGHIISDKDKDNVINMSVPNDLLESLENIHTYKEMIQFMKRDTIYNQQVRVNNNGTGAGAYSFFCYIIPVMGFLIGKILGLNIIVAYYLARIFAFIAFLIASYIAIKKIPFGKIPLFIFLFNPMLIQQCVSISADNAVIVSSILLISFTLNFYYSKNEIDNRQLFLLGCLSVILSLMKYAYLPIVFILISLFFKKRKISKKNIFKIIGIIIISVIVSLTAYFIFNNMYVSENSYIIQNNISAARQIIFIIKHPLKYLYILINTTKAKLEFYYFTLFGRNLSWYIININQLIPILYSFLFFSSPFVEKNKIELDRNLKILLIFLSIVGYVLILSGLYLAWTPVGTNIIEGVQGRYFIPYLILIPLVFINKGKNLEIKKYNLKTSILLILINLCCINSIINFFNY